MIEQQTARLPLLSTRERIAVEDCRLNGFAAVQFICAEQGIALPLRYDPTLERMVLPVSAPVPQPFQRPDECALIAQTQRDTLFTCGVFLTIALASGAVMGILVMAALKAIVSVLV